MTSTPRLFDRALLRQRQIRAARLGTAPDFLDTAVAADLSDRLAAVLRRFPLALDLGGTGTATTEALQTSGSVDCLIRGALAPISARGQDRIGLVCDEEFLPFGEGAFDLVVSCLALHQVNDVPGALVQIRRALRDDGLFLGAVLGGETLSELAQAFVEAELSESGGTSPRVGPFADVRAYGGLLQRAGFAMPVVDTDRVTVTYESPLALMADLRAMGATNVLTERSRRPLRRQILTRMVECYAAAVADGRGRVPATFDIITLTGWAPADHQPKPLRPGSAQTRLADALGVVEQSAGEKTDGSTS